jgi:hypothetical protein
MTASSGTPRGRAWNVIVIGVVLVVLGLGVWLWSAGDRGVTDTPSSLIGEITGHVAAVAGLITAIAGLVKVIRNPKGT